MQENAYVKVFMHGYKTEWAIMKSMMHDINRAQKYKNVHVPL